jgi:hypothetical protein
MNSSHATERMRPPMPMSLSDDQLTAIINAAE